jgi:hypothetical protein
MTKNNCARRVHLVGSIPLQGAREVFQAASEELGALAPRLPDGETGDRSAWLHFQQSILNETPNLQKTGSYDLKGHLMPTYGVANAGSPLSFGPLRYADEAMASYEIFSQMKAAGQIPPATRFQVCLPTPVAVMCAFIDGPSQAQVETAYQRRLLQEVVQIAAHIPPGELAIQWDVAYEVYISAGWEGNRYRAASKEEMLRKLVPLGNGVPADVHLGFHLCYGDLGHKHFIEPDDLALCVKIANLLAQNLSRPLNWIHMPVPRDRDEDKYFSPLTDLRVGAETELYLGIIHLTDGIGGYRKRFTAAHRFCSSFGIGTECGFGRRPPETVRELLKLHALAAQDE